MNRRILIVSAVLITLLLVTNGLLFNGILRQRREQAELQLQLTPLQAALDSVQGDVPLLVTRQAELEAREAELQSIDFAFPQEVASLDVLAVVVLQADIHAVTLPRISAQPATTLTVGGVEYRVLNYEVTAQGTLNAISNFIQALEAGPIDSMTIGQINVTARPTPTPHPTSPSQAEILYRAELQLRIYTRPLAPNATPVAVNTPSVSTEALIEQLRARLQEAQQEGTWERAISLLVVLRQLQPEDETLDAQLVEAYVNAGQQHLDAGRYPQADQNFRAALALDPDNARAQAALAQLQQLTPTPTSTVTLTPTPSPTPSPTLTPTPSVTPMPYYVHRLEHTANTRYPSLGCDWFGFYGKITDVNGYPVPGVNIHLWAQDWVGVTTTSSSSGEYELYLDNHPKKETWFIQLFAGGEAISEAIAVESRADCGSALIIMDWKRGY